MAIKNPKVGDKVAYEDFGNPTRVGTVTAVLYHVVWDQKSQFPVVTGGTPVPGTMDSLQGEGWRNASDPVRVLPKLDRASQEKRSQSTGQKK